MSLCPRNAAESSGVLFEASRVPISAGSSLMSRSTRFRSPSLAASWTGQAKVLLGYDMDPRAAIATRKPPANLSRTSRTEPDMTSSHPFSTRPAHFISWRGSLLALEC